MVAVKMTCGCPRLSPADILNFKQKKLSCAWVEIDSISVSMVTSHLVFLG